MGHIGPACREWRRSRGITQVYIARLAHMSRSQVCRFEKGEVTSNRLLFFYIKLGFPVTEDMLVQYLGGA
jgi:transcriptional regulator with XRE-family HTH domain